jgi:hypothetical protein
MNRTEHEKRLLLQKIDSHRELLRIELDALGVRIRPISYLVSWGKRVGLLWSVLDSAVRSLRVDENSRWARWIRLTPWAVLALPLAIKLWKRGATDRAD